jgi:putative SOS response-associated peptidase YedK
VKQPYAIAMKDGAPFGIAGIWENWKEPKAGEWLRTFAIITADANEMVAQIHDRMPLILAPGDYARWLGEGARPARPDAAVPGRADADVADLDPSQQARKRRSFNCEADQAGNG